MKLTITSLDKVVGTVDVPEETIISGLKLLVSVECGLPVDQFSLVKDGAVLTDPNANLINAGLHDDDLLILVPSNGTLSDVRSPIPNLGFSSIRLPNPSGAVTPTTEAEVLRRSILNGPPRLLSALRQRYPDLASAITNSAEFARIYQSQQTESNARADEMRNILYGDPLDPVVQGRIAELIRQKNIDMHMEAALEHYPETFAQVSMLFINCKVGTTPIKAFVDSGAQSTIMSEECARRCNLEPLIDKRWAGMAYGVGMQQIIGRIHNAHMEIGGIFLPTSFIILKDQRLDLMLGLDMLKRHQCCIDLKRNVLTLDAGRVETHFLPESEIPAHMRHGDLTVTDHHSPIDGQTALNRLNTEQREKIFRLTDQGVPFERALHELETHGWDVQEALISFMSNEDSH